MNLLIIGDGTICNLINNRGAETTEPFQEIQTIQNGRETLVYFGKVYEGRLPCPDVILVDLSMPVMHGFDFVEALDQLSFPNEKNIGIVMLTSSDDSSALRAARTFGIDHYLLRPLTINYIQATILSLDKTLWKRSVGMQ